MQLAEAPRYNSPTIESLKERHWEMMRRLVAGDPAVDICRDMGMTQSWFSIVQASPVFQSELRELREKANRSATDISGRIRRLAPSAMDVLERAVREKQDEINATQRAKFAVEALALAGHTKPLSGGAAQANVRVEIVNFITSGASAPTTPVATIIVDTPQETICES
jgi:hypothetical protein